MSTISELSKELLGQEVTIETRTTDRSFGGVLVSIDIDPQGGRLGPTVVLKDEDGMLEFVFDISSVSPGLPEDDDEDEEESEAYGSEEEDDDDDEDEDDEEDFD